MERSLSIALSRYHLLTVSRKPQKALLLVAVEKYNFLARFAKLHPIRPSVLTDLRQQTKTFVSGLLATLPDFTNRAGSTPLDIHGGQLIRAGITDYTRGSRVAVYPFCAHYRGHGERADADVSGSVRGI